jgi:hypothetical protein
VLAVLAGGIKKTAAGLPQAAVFKERSCALFELIA